MTVSVTGSGVSVVVTGSGVSVVVTGSGVSVTVSVTGSGVSVVVTGSGVSVVVTGSGISVVVTGSGISVVVTGSGVSVTVSVTGSGVSVTVSVTGSGVSVVVTVDGGSVFVVVTVSVTGLHTGHGARLITVQVTFSPTPVGTEKVLPSRLITSLGTWPPDWVVHFTSSRSPLVSVMDSVVGIRLSVTRYRRVALPSAFVVTLPPVVALPPLSTEMPFAVATASNWKSASSPSTIAPLLLVSCLLITSSPWQSPVACLLRSSASSEK